MSTHIHRGSEKDSNVRSANRVINDTQTENADGSDDDYDGKITKKRHSHTHRE